MNIYQDLPDFRDVTVSGKSVYPSVDNADGVATFKCGPRRAYVITLLNSIRIGPEDMIKEEIPAEPHLTTREPLSLFSSLSD